MNELDALSFDDKLKVFQGKTDEMGLREARVGFFFKNDPDKEVGLLSETFCACVKNSRPRTYPDKTVAMPGMLATNRAIWHGGVVHFGGPEWHESKTETGRYFPHPGKDLKPEGNLRDNKEKNRSRNIAFNPDRAVDHQLLSWGLELFNAAHLRQRDNILLPKVIPPVILSPIPMNKVSWMTLRPGPTLDRMTELIVNLRRYRVRDPEIQLCAPSNGLAVRDGQSRNYQFHGEDPDGTYDETIEDPSTLLQYYIERTFGAVVRVELFPMYTEPTLVANDQALYTPIKEQAENPARQFTLGELKKLPNFQALQYIVVLSCATNISGLPYVDAEMAFSDREPLIQMSSDFPRVQRVHNIQDAFKSKGSAHRIDMLDVPHRVHMRKFKELHEKEKAAKEAKANIVREKVDGKAEGAGNGPA